MNQLCSSPNKVNRAFSCVHTFTHNCSYMQFRAHAFVFMSIADNPPHQFRFTALPIDKNISACFSSAIKDVSYWCQHNSGPIMPCRLGIQCLFGLVDSVPYIHYSSDSETILCVYHRHWLCKLQAWKWNRNYNHLYRRRCEIGIISVQSISTQRREK